jgi:two-component system response regulator AtoC
VAAHRDESTRLKAARPANEERETRIIVFWDGGSASRAIEPGERVVVGRADDCDLAVPDDSVSRHHLAVYGDRPARIEDLGSANGTMVGGERLEPGRPLAIAPTMVVEIGDALLLVRAVEPERRVDAQAPPSRRVPGGDPATARMNELVELVAGTTISVLLLGETGAGKGVLAQMIHERSPRAAGPLLRVNCASLTETLLESELFGHERGAFTGATQAKPGLLEAANGGTLLLDEIGEMPLATQAKLLHVLEHGEVMRVGAVKPRPMDVRFVAATNRDLPAAAEQGRFRQDLYFRLNGLTIVVPPLRERPSEIAGLAAEFVTEAARRLGRDAPEIEPDALAAMRAYAWPGNVRELRNAMVRAALFARGGRIAARHLDMPSPAAPPAPTTSAANPGSAPQAAPAVLRDEVRDLERRRIVETLERFHHNQVETARALGIARGTLRSRMKELGLLAAKARGSGD